MKAQKITGTRHELIGRNFSYVCEYTGETITETVTNWTGPLSSDMLQCASCAVYGEAFVRRNLA